MRQVLRRFFVLGSSSLLTQLIAFASLAIAARRVGPSALGSYTVALSIVSFLSLPMSLGMTAVGTRDVAREPSRVRELTGEVFVLQLVMAAAGYVILVALAPAIAPNGAMRSLMPIVALFLITGTSFEWTLQALGEMRLIAIARIAGQLAFGVLVPFLVVDGFRGMRIYAWLMIGGLAVKHVLTTIFLLRVAGPPKLRVAPARLWRRLRASVAMSYASVMVTIYGSIDQVMVGYLSTAYDAGEYAAAYRIPNAVGTFAGSWFAVIFPHSAVLGESDPGRLRHDAGRLLSVVALFALPLAACTPFVAHGLMTAAFGVSYGAAGTAFALLTVAIALSLFDSTLVTLLMGVGRERAYASIITVTVVLNIAINAVMIPVLGRDGAAIDTIVSELVGAALLIRTVRRSLGGIDVEWMRLLRIGAAVVPAVVALVAVPGSVSVWLRIVVGAAVYGVAVVATGGVAVRELRSVFARRAPRPMHEVAEARQVSEPEHALR